MASPARSWVGSPQCSLLRCMWCISRKGTLTCCPYLSPYSCLPHTCQTGRFVGQGLGWGSPAARRLPGAARRCPTTPDAGLGTATLVNWGSEATLAAFICRATPPEACPERKFPNNNRVSASSQPRSSSALLFDLLLFLGAAVVVAHGSSSSAPPSSPSPTSCPCRVNSHSTAAGRPASGSRESS